MKKIATICILFLSLGISNFVNAQCVPPLFFISAPNGTVVGCNPNTVPLSAVNASTLTNVTYTWTSSITGTIIGTSINGSAPTGTNIYTVFASSPSSTCIVTETIQILSFTATPNATVTPISRTITCNGAPATFTAVCSPTVNVQGQWFAAGGTPLTSQGNSPVLMATSVPGTYSFVATSLTNGCASIQTVAVVANTVVPTMTVISLVGATITCNNPCLLFNTVASPGPPPKTYSWTNVTTSVTVTPPTGSYSICVPGKYVADYMDGNMCKISQTITVMIDTLRPTPLSSTSLSGNSYTLSCFNPSLVATGYSNPLLSSTNYSWTIPPNLTVASNTISVFTVSVTTNPTTFTVLAMGSNGCVGKQKVNFYKDVTVPPYSVVFTPSVITCANPNVAMSPSGSSTVPVTFTFTSPAPTTTANTSGALFSIPGTYTMTYQNLNNGCIATTNTVVPLNTTPPATITVGPYFIPCGGGTVLINAGTISQPPNYTYTWSPPMGAGMSCVTCYSTSANMAGIYTVVITNTINGCVATNTLQVSQGTTFITGSASICNGQTTTLTANGATTYTWNTGSNATSIVVNPTVTTTYSLSGTASCSVSPSVLTVTVSSCIGIQELNAFSGIVLSPNPNNGNFNLKIESQIENAEIIIYNSIGQMVYKQNVKQGDNYILNKDLSKGIYHYSITDRKQVLGRGKLLIE